MSRCFYFIWIAKEGFSFEKWWNNYRSDVRVRVRAKARISLIALSDCHVARGNKAQSGSRWGVAYVLQHLLGHTNSNRELWSGSETDIWRRKKKNQPVLCSWVAHHSFPYYRNPFWTVKVAKCHEWQWQPLSEIPLFIPNPNTQFLPSPKDNSANFTTLLCIIGGVPNVVASRITSKFGPTHVLVIRWIIKLISKHLPIHK